MMGLLRNLVDKGLEFRGLGSDRHKFWRPLAEPMCMPCLLVQLPMQITAEACVVDVKQKLISRLCVSFRGQAKTSPSYIAATQDVDAGMPGRAGGGGGLGITALYGIK